MDITTFQCPHCQAVLRMRKKQTGDSTFHCPDCNHPIQITQTLEGPLSISPVKSAPVAKAPSGFSRKAQASLKSLRRGAAFLMASPVLMSWIIAGIGAFLILLLMLFDQSPSSTVALNEEVTTEMETPAPVPEATENPEPPEPDAPQPVMPPIPEPDQTASAKPAKAPELVKVQELIAIKPEQIHPLVAQKPLPPAPLPTPKTDVTAALQISIVEFRQPNEIPLNKLIRQLEEMLDTKFQVAENITSDPRLLETPVSFSIKNTTLSNLLKQILSKAALTFTVKSNKIYIERSEAP